jgi:hypothetical protein
MFTMLEPLGIDIQNSINKEFGFKTCAGIQKDMPPKFLRNQYSLDYKVGGNPKMK